MINAKILAVYNKSILYFCEKHKMNYQEKLLQAIRSKIQNNSVNETIATVLNISYDAAHRRVCMKSKFSIEETALLCQHFKISLDNLFKKSNQIIASKTFEIKSQNDLLQYFKDSLDHIKDFEKIDSAFIYSAKDLPIFYTIGGTLLAKFKLFVWLNLLSKETNTQFESFYLEENIQEFSQEMIAIYNQAHVQEIWNDTTINSTVQQILYYYQSGLVSLKNALLLYDDVFSILTSVEDKSSNNPNFHLYYNELLILNNNVLATNSSSSKLFVPYTMLGYFITEDKTTINNTQDFLESQIKNSKSLTLSGTKDRKQFFNKAKEKVAYFKNKIENELIM